MSVMGHNRALGKVGENDIRCDLYQKGYVVSLNDEGDKADLTVRVYQNDGNSPSEYFGLQSKYAGSAEHSHTVELTTSSGGYKNERTFAAYKPGDFEVFGVDFVGTFGKIAYIPQCLVRAQPNGTLTVRITPPINGVESKSFWPIWDFLSVEKARKCKNPSDYRIRFDGTNDEEDAVFLKEWEELEKYIQYQWMQLRRKTPHNGVLIDLIHPQDKQYPKWFRSDLIGNQVYTSFGEEPHKSLTDVRSSNSTKIRSDLKRGLILPGVFETAITFVENA